MLLKLKMYDYKAAGGLGAFVPLVPAKYFSTAARVRKGYKLDASYRFVYPYGHGDVVAPTCLAKWVD